MRPTREEYYLKVWNAKFRALMERGEPNASVRATAQTEDHMCEMALQDHPPWRSNT